VVLIIPRILRRYFLYDRKLLSELSRCGWASLKTFDKIGIRDEKAFPGAVFSYIDDRGFNWVGFHILGMLPESFHISGSLSYATTIRKVDMIRGEKASS